MTPALLRKVVHAGVTGSSFKSGARDLNVLAEADISSQRVRRAVEQIGNQRARQTSDAMVQQLRMVHVLSSREVRSFADHFIRKA